MKGSELCFRRMTLADIKWVMKVEREVYQFPWTDKIFNDCIRVGYHCWLALHQQHIVGHAVISVTAGESHMLNLSIAREHQRKGYGRQFIEFLIDEARERNAQTMLLEVRPSNAAAINCYNSAGFNEIGCRKDYYPAPEGREDALLFARQISQPADLHNS
ncbi:MAG: ribosomal protein S18-alanine N-acetyltransferase [Gammaproteobacteria bacterium]|nr:ribosomal protein S18-alanine N-acetyltransferase [Gammaproteobacteria bacterium]MBT8437826.1 ribosomal protein S18-alanine N-acetyltransferase [Gammaproteobacteria bacterium]